MNYNILYVTTFGFGTATLLLLALYIWLKKKSKIDAEEIIEAEIAIGNVAKGNRSFRK